MIRGKRTSNFMEAKKIVEQKVQNSLWSDENSIETSIEGNLIKVKVK
jgi:hypothetical protein